MPGDEELGFEAAVAALGRSSLSSSEWVLPAWPGLDFHAVCAGMKTTVSEAEHPLLCEGTRRVKGDLALALMITYKDDQCKLKKVGKSCSCTRHYTWWSIFLLGGGGVLITPTKCVQNSCRC